MFYFHMYTNALRLYVSMKKSIRNKKINIDKVKKNDAWLNNELLTT